MNIDWAPLRGTWWRQTAAGLDPLELRNPPGDGRWQRGDVVGATYLADSAETVWAEWYRALAERALPPSVWLPCDLWRVDVHLERVADLSRLERLSALGLDAPRPDRSTWPPYQDVGEQIAAGGGPGLIAPQCLPSRRTRALPLSTRPPAGRRLAERSAAPHHRGAHPPARVAHVAVADLNAPASPLARPGNSPGGLF